LRSRTRGWPPSGLSSRKWGLAPPQHRFPLRSACLAVNSLPRAKKHLAGEGCRPHAPAFRCTRLVLLSARYHGQRSDWQAGLPPPRPRFPLRSACLAVSSLPRAKKRLAGEGCRPRTPAFRCARLVLQTARYRGQRSALNPARALAHSYHDHPDAASIISRVGERQR
jgi:hypothetical protein